MNLYIDIDGTICTNTKDNYEDASPIEERIAKVNKLYEEGNTITYWTARGSRSGNDYTDLTRKQLQKWGCKYNKLLFGKPSYDLYIDDKSHNVDVYWPTQNKTKKETTTKIEKGWGHEIIFANNQKYCGKILHFHKDSKFSMHFHIKKEETWYVASGKFKFKWINTDTADVEEVVLNVGDCITNKIGEPHQLFCLEEGDIFEVSTTHYDNDSYRVMKGDSQIHSSR
jgi:mannose-6-phosphate isomerase-like protein (cupin superfamily)